MTPPSPWNQTVHGSHAGSAPNDAATGLIQLGARYYDPALAQFISPDPLLAPFEPASLNPYSNAFNNPLTYTDPTGLYPDPGCNEMGGVCDDGTDPVEVPTPDPDNPLAPPPFEGSLPDEELWEEAWWETAPDYLYIEWDGSLSETTRVSIAFAICDGVDDICSHEYAEYLMELHWYAHGAMIFGSSDFGGGASSAGPVVGAAAAAGIGGMWKKSTSPTQSASATTSTSVPGQASFSGSRRNTADQDALIQLAKQAKAKGGVTARDGRVLTDWADELNVPAHPTMTHPSHSGTGASVPHIRIGPVWHIPVGP